MELKLCIGFLATFIVQSCVRADCPDSWVSFRGSCYLFSRDPKTFTVAVSYCLQRGAHLVHINTSDENLFLKSFCRESLPHNYWIGLTDTDIEGIWKWKDNDEAVTFDDFGPNEPGGGHGENCVNLFSAFDYKWVDITCNAQSMPICEKSSSDGNEVHADG